MNTPAKVSVITPTYNRSQLLVRSIQTVLAQSYSDLELIVVDDGSTDQTSQTISEFKDARLHYLRFDHNQGIGAARAKGVECATGDWIAFLDSDDVWLPEKITVDLAILERHPEIDILFDNYRNINYMQGSDQTGFEQTRSAFERLTTTELEPGVIRIDAGLPQALLTANLIGTASIITMRRDVFQKVGNFNIALSGPEDFEMMWRAALSGAIFAYNTRLLVERHKDQDSITARSHSFTPRYLTALDFCEAATHGARRLELIHDLNQARGRAWCSLVHTCAVEGRRAEAQDAFRNSLRYGFTIEACIYLIAALAGPKAISWAKRVRKGLNT